MRIFLIGYMGSGKTAVGKMLATHFSYPQIDLDQEIEKVAQKKISQIFEEDGEAYFRSLETEVLQLITMKYEKIIISTGGGTPCFENNMKWMKDHGLTIYLNASINLLVGRLKQGFNHRPLISERDDIKSFVESHINERKSYYEEAHCTISFDTNLSIEELLKLLPGGLSPSSQ